MTAFLSLLCSDPLLSSCHSARRNTLENDYLLDTDSWDLRASPLSHTKATSEPPSLKLHRTESQRKEPTETAALRAPRKRPRLRRIMNFVSSLNPLKLSRESDESTEPNRKLTVPSRTVSFAAVSPTASYHVLSDATTTDDDEEDDSEIRHFAIVDIVPGQQPRFIGNARRRDRCRWAFSRDSARSFDAALRRRRSLSSQRTHTVARRAFSLNRVAEWDAASRRVAYGCRPSRRPESTIIGVAADDYRRIRRANDRPIFYNDDDDVDAYDFSGLPFGHPARCAFRDSGFYEALAPPRPPKPRRHRKEQSPSILPYINDPQPPPRPPKPTNLNRQRSYQSDISIF